MAAKTRNISTLIESQLPGFIIEDYAQMKTFIESYYEQQELRGQPLDIIHNITEYRNIDFYSNKILKEKTTLAVSVAANDTTIVVSDATSFPEVNGYIQIDNEILFYKERTDTEFLEVSRGVSGNNTLGDLYNKSKFVSTSATAHTQNADVLNISNLFLYAFVRNFEREYLASFPEKFLKGDVDKRTLIKNIGDFYRAKGTDRSIQFLFKTIISRDPQEKVSVYNPKDTTLKASTSDWISSYTLKVKVLSGDLTKLVGAKITQGQNSAVVDNVTPGNLILAPESVVGEFNIVSSTSLKKEPLLASYGSGYKVTVDSTQGFPQQGTLTIGSATIEYLSKSVNQFTISKRSATNTNFAVGTPIYAGDVVTGTYEGGTVRFIITGVVYNLLPSNPKPYASAGDQIQLVDTFDSISPVIKNTLNNNRWLLNPDYSEPNSIHANIDLDGVVADVSAIFEDEQYFYICSSSFPSNSDLLTPQVTVSLDGQEILKLIRKHPITTTEVYSTGNKDVGILVDGTPVYSNRSEEEVVYGKIETITLQSKGRNYKVAPTVLVNEQPNKATAVLAGETVSRIDPVDFDTTLYEEDPTIRITAGEGAILSAVVTNGAITSINVDNPGRYYTSPPTILITDLTGRGSFAEYEAVVSNGEIVECVKITEGKLYNPQFTSVVAVASGTGASATAKVRRWAKNRYRSLQSVLDTNNGYAFPSRTGKVGYGYGVVANPVILRRRLLDSIDAVYEETATILHSPILGYAYDGNPIYGPYGYSNPLDRTSSVVRMNSGYTIKTSRVNGPSNIFDPLGSFVDDYEWKPSINSGKTELDANNGRFCVTPDYPNGVYAYFLTIDADNNPVFPYVLGSNFYSLPVDSNYNTPISQRDLPKDIKRLGFAGSGVGLKATIKDVSKGRVSGANVISSTEEFEVGSNLLIENKAVNAQVSTLKGKEVVGIESNQTKALEITTSQSVYLFAGDIITQGGPGGATGEVVTNTFNGNNFIVRNVQPNINDGSLITATGGTLDSSSTIQKFILDASSTYTVGSTLNFINEDEQEIEATAEILESTIAQNSVIVRVLTGTFTNDSGYYLSSSTLSDTARTGIESVQDLSVGLEIFDINDSIAILETATNHGVSVGDIVDVDITPDESGTETTYYVRKKIYQDVTTVPPKHQSVITDTGIGSGDVINTGNSYLTGTFNDVELVFRDSSQARPGVGLLGDPNNARATIVIGNPNGSGFGPVASIIITNKGSGYRKEDVLTFVEGVPVTNVAAGGPQNFAFVVDHVGFAASNTRLYLSNVTNLSNGDFLKVGQEIVEIQNVNLVFKYVTVGRARKGTFSTNHYDGNVVNGEEIPFRISNGYRPFGAGAGNPIATDYDAETGKLTISYDYNDNINLINKVIGSSVFFDESTPKKTVTLTNVEEASYKLELSKDDETNFIVNPSFDVLKYYSYRFDTGHFSMANTFLDISPSINYNILVDGKEVGSINPGTAGSYTRIRFGFTPDIATLDQERVDLRYSTFYYFIKASGVDTEESKINIVNDPLVGRKKVTHITNTKLVYDLDSIVEYDGSGEISYTTTSTSAFGAIHDVSIRSSKKDLDYLPIVFGVYPREASQAVLEPVIENGTITKVDVIKRGSGYVKPKLVFEGDGTGVELALVVIDGSIVAVRVDKGGRGYTSAKAEVVESNTTIYLESSNIGVPLNVEIGLYGSGFNTDYSTRPTFRSKTVLVLEDADLFKPQSQIVQDSSGSKANVDSWRMGGNLLKVSDVEGIFEVGQPIRDTRNNSTANVKHVLETDFNEDVKSYSQQGYFASVKGYIGENRNKITDSYFYQDYSYVVESDTPVDIWRDLILETTHPAGFELFGEVNVFSQGSAPMPQASQAATPITCNLNLSIKAIETINTSRVVTTHIAKFADSNVKRGKGAISISDVDLSATNFQDIRLEPNFDGIEDPNTGKRVGTTVFTMYQAGSNNTIVAYNDQEFFITLDGILQEPGEAFTVLGSQIVFDTAPLGERVVEGQDVDEQKFYGKQLKYNDAVNSDQYLRKFQDISGEFDNIKSDFDLYYDDGSIAKTEENELLIVVIDGVKQRYGEAYEILRYEDPATPDKIKFIGKPEVEDPLYDAEDEREDRVLRNGQKCYIFGIGNYFTATISTDNIVNNPIGPFIIKNSLTGNAVEVPDPDYGIVFVNNVLQIPGKAYNITGSVITFRQPLPYAVQSDGSVVVAPIEIIYVYGKTTDQVLTLHDFEPDVYLRDVTVEITDAYADEFFFFYNTTAAQQDLASGDSLWVEDLAPVEDRLTYQISADWTLLSSGTGYTEEKVYANVPFYNVATQTFVVTLAGGQYLIDGVPLPTLQLSPGNTYRFDVSDPSLVGSDLTFQHQVDSSFIRQEDIGFQGEPNSFIDLIIFPEAPEGLAQINYTNLLDAPNTGTVDVLAGPTGQYGYGFKVARLRVTDNGEVILESVVWNQRGERYQDGDITLSIGFVGYDGLGNGDISIQHNLAYRTTEVSAGTNEYLLGRVKDVSQDGNVTRIRLESKFSWPEDVLQDKVFVYKRDYRIGSSIESRRYNIRGLGYSVTSTEPLDANGFPQLKRNTTYWLNGTKDDNAYYERTKLFSNLHPKDKVCISGETHYREIKTISRLAKRTHFDPGKYLGKDHAVRVTTSAYNGTQSGSGLSIYAPIDSEGRVTDLIWNRPEWNAEFTRRSETARGYLAAPKLYFIPKTPAGGGAQAAVYFHKGIVSVDLIRPGYGYEEPPTVVVAKPYDVLRNPNRKIDSVSNLTFNLSIPNTFFSITTLNEIAVGSTEEFLSIINLTIFVSAETSDQITTIIEPEVATVRLRLETELTYLDLETEIVDLPPTVLAFNALDVNETLITQFIQTEQVVGDEVIIEEAIIDLEFQLEVIAAQRGATASTSDQFAIIAADFLIGDTILYVLNSNNFPEEGNLIIGYTDSNGYERIERVSYFRREYDRFFIDERGVGATLEADHFAGTLAKLEPPLVFVRDVDIDTQLVPPPVPGEVGEELFGSVAMPFIIENFTPILKQVQFVSNDNLAVRDIESDDVISRLELIPIDLSIESIEIETQKGGVIVVPGAFIPVFLERVFVNELPSGLENEPEVFYPQGSLTLAVTEPKIYVLKQNDINVPFNVDIAQWTQVHQDDDTIFTFFVGGVPETSVDVTNEVKWFRQIEPSFGNEIDVAVVNIELEIITLLPQIDDVEDIIIWEATRVVPFNVDIAQWTQVHQDDDTNIFLDSIISIFLEDEFKIPIEDRFGEQLFAGLPGPTFYEVFITKPIEIDVTISVEDFSIASIVQNNLRYFVFDVDAGASTLTANSDQSPWAIHRVWTATNEEEVADVKGIESFVNLIINPVEDISMEGVFTIFGAELIEIVQDDVVSLVEIETPYITPVSVEFEKTNTVPLWSGGAEFRGQVPLDESGQELFLDTPYVGETLDPIFNMVKVWQYQTEDFAIISIRTTIERLGSEINGSELFVAFDPESPVQGFLDGGEPRSYGDGPPADSVFKIVNMWSGGAAFRGQVPLDESGQELKLETPYQGDELGTVFWMEKIWQYDCDQTNLNVVKQIERDYPNRHLEPGAFQLSGQGFYGDAGMPQQAFVFEVFFTETIPGAGVDPEDPTDIQKIIVRSVELEDVIFNLRREAEWVLVPGDNINTTLEVRRTIGEPTEGGQLYGVVNVLNIFTNFNDFEDLPTPPYEEDGAIFSDVTEVLMLEPFSVESWSQRNITREVNPSAGFKVFQEIRIPYDSTSQDNLAVVDIDSNVTSVIVQEDDIEIFIGDINSEVNITVVTGIADQLDDELDSQYLRTTLGMSFGMYERNAFVSNGSLNINGSIAETLASYEILEFERGESSILTNGTRFRLGFPSINEIGGTLQFDLLDTNDTLVPINSSVDLTDLDWPTSGTIIVANTSDPDPANHTIEEIEYTGIAGTFLTGITRGANGTTVQTHLATGSYLRTIG